jgi:hypothetical protein
VSYPYYLFTEPFCRPNLLQLYHFAFVKVRPKTQRFVGVADGVADKISCNYFAGDATGHPGDLNHAP